MGMQANTLYSRLGGDIGVRQLTERFYDLMDLEPTYQALRAVHGSTLVQAQERLYQFLSGWLGGPDLYTEQHGHPRLRQRHFPFVVNMQMRNEWVVCFAQALSELDVAEQDAEPLLLQIFVMADWMRNQEESAHPVPMPPMMQNIQERIPVLADLLHKHGVRRYFQAS